MKKFLKLLLDVGIIAISFETSEYLAEHIFRRQEWFVELLLYMTVYLALNGLVWLVKRAFVRKEA